MDATWKAKVHLELNPVRDVKDKKGFFKDISSKWKTRENVGLLLNEVSALVMKDTEKLLNATFVSVFTDKTSPQKSQTLEEREKIWRKEDFPLVKEDQVRDHLCKLDIHKSMGPEACAHECQERWQMLLLSHSPSSLKGHGEQERYLRTGGKLMSIYSSKAARRRTHEAT
ncbi:rna-directed dna polymerase from mobile element jockey-like [Pitangus sulphuratus]|nr:rna-directed dna polymerase from mobile element jockey-like [Pitangus sulphuratus]